MSEDSKDAKPSEDEARRLAADPEVSLPAQVEGEPGFGGGEEREPFEIPAELLDLLKATGREWQGKAESALALWLDEASLALRREGLPGLRRVMREKADSARRRAETGDMEKDFDALIGRVVGTIGRDIASAAISAAFAGFAAAGTTRRTGRETRENKPGDVDDSRS